MFKQLACSDILLKNKNHWSSSEELSAIYTQGIYKWQAINRRSFGSYNLCWNSIETSKNPIWTVPSFYYFFLSLPGIHCTLVSNTGRFFGEYLFVCFLWITGVSVVWILQLVLLNDVTTLLESENGIQTQYSRGETTSGYGSHSYWSKLRWDPTPQPPSFWPTPSLSHVSKHSSHLIQRKLNLFKELKT